MAKQPQFRTLRPYKDHISARDWNTLTGAVMTLCRSLGVKGIFDGSGLHIRGTRNKHWPPYYRIISNDGEGAYTVRPQKFTESSQTFEDLPDASDITAYEIYGSATGSADDIIAVRMELSLEGEWVGLFEIASGVSWGQAYEAIPWGVDDKYIMLHPCDDYAGTGVNEAVNIKAYVFGCFDEGAAAQAPDGLQVAKDDVLAYLPIGSTEGVLVGPPLRLPPGGIGYMPITKKTDDDYDYHWDWLRLHGDE